MNVLTGTFEDQNHSRLIQALVLSLLLHLGFLYAVSVNRPAIVRRPLKVSFVPLPQKKAIPKREKPQIVSPSAAPETEAPPDTNFLSKTNSQTDREQIRRGLVEQTAPPTPPVEVKPPSQPQAEAKPQQVKTVQEPEPVKGKPSTAPPVLKLSSDELLRNFSGTIPLSKKAQKSSGEDGRSDRKSAPEETREQKLRKYRPFGKQTRSIFTPGPIGVPDYLPNIQDGDITLLNTKADKHAVFVRRVALQVFGALRRLNWQDIPYSEARAARDYAEVIAIMSPKGKLLSVSLRNSSENRLFDGVLRRAAQEGAWDQNPPPGAKAADGNIHFIFKSKMWSRRVGDARIEQRWLLLGTGLL